MTEHPTRFLWTRYLVGELDDSQKTQLGDHLASCEECTALVGQLREVQTMGRQIAPPLQIEPARQAWSRWLALPVVAAVAVLLVLVLRGPRSKPPAPRPGIQAKGNIRVSALCKVGERAWRCNSGETLVAGASVRFELDLSNDQYVLIVGVDAAGRIQRYFPDSPRARKLPAAETTLLPTGHSLVLDDSVGDERFYVLSSDRPFDASVARFRNNRLALRAPGAQVEQRRFVFHKKVSQIDLDARSIERTDAGAKR